MKFSEHTENIRQLTDTSFRNRLGRMGISAAGVQPVESIPETSRYDRMRIETIRDISITETGSELAAYEKLVEELTFTLFNRIAVLKVMEAHALHAEIITRRSQHGERSFAHLMWLEQNLHGRDLELEGLVEFLEDQLQSISSDIPLFSPSYLFHLLPTAIELNGIINAFNTLENDPQVGPDIWKSDDILGWLYESYNNYKKAAHKESKEKTEYNKVCIQSQVYTPRWVVKFLVDNSLGKLYLEMYPDSDIRNRYKIAPSTGSGAVLRERKPLTEIRMIDIATGSGNFLLYGFDLFYDLYKDQIENYGADYDEKEIPGLIIKHNLYGIDIDDRAIQIAQLGLYIKVKCKLRNATIEHFNIVSSDFFLPEFEKVRYLFENGGKLDKDLEALVTDLWADLQQAYKFGSLLRLEEKMDAHLNELTGQFAKQQTNLFAEVSLANYDQFRENFFYDLKQAVAHNAEKLVRSFLNVKTDDAITFLELLTQKYDVAVANPPYTDSGDFGPELKKFIETNYKKPFKFNSNLYAVFIKRCYEVINEHGKMALIHPLTFMYLKTYEDVRRFIIENLKINVFVDYGNSNLFGSILVDPAFYVFERTLERGDAWFISLDQYTRTIEEKAKKAYCLLALDNYISKQQDKNNYVISQNKLKIIEGWPFIYWISEGFREKFRGNTIGNLCNIVQGLATANNDRFLRYWWEVSFQYDINNSNKKWCNYAKGGPFKKWYGNNWTVVNWENDGFEIKNYRDDTGKIRSRPQNERFYFKDGITYSASGQKGVSFRLLPSNSLFDVGGSCIFLGKYTNIYYVLSFLNSKLSFFITDSLNPTVNTQVGDLERIPFVIPDELNEKRITIITKKIIEIKKKINSFQFISIDFIRNPLCLDNLSSLQSRLLSFLSLENALNVSIHLCEAIANDIIFNIYTLSPEDRHQVESKMGKPVGELPISDELRNPDSQWETIKKDLSITPEQESFVDNLQVIQFTEEKIREVKEGFSTLYQSNNDLEEFCIRHQVNPINVWYWFRESKILPSARAAEIVMEFIADSCRTLLMEDADGIIPLTGLPCEPRLLDRLEQHCLEKGLTQAQFMQLDGLLGRPLNEYIEHHFFRDFSDHLNLFMYLPKTPFIWHLSSGEHQGFEAYITIYKWNRDSLFKLKPQYLSKRTEKLEYRQIELVNSTTAQVQNEKELIRLQLQEIAEFTKNVDELISEGYDPKLDDGVGKNIAPLQKKGMLRCEVLNKKQLEKYLNADW